jgi:hypothetical protein
MVKRPGGARRDDAADRTINEKEVKALNPLAICDVGGEPQHQYENKSWIEILLGCPD